MSEKTLSEKTLSKRSRIVFIVAAFALVPAACGDDSSGDGAIQDAGSDAADGTIGGVDLGDATGVSDECATVAEATLQAATAAGAAISPSDDIADVESYFDSAADAAPEEIRDDFATLADAFSAYAQILQDSGADLTDPNSFADPQVAAAMQEAVQTFSTDDYQAAANNIAAWAAENCDTAG